MPAQAPPESHALEVPDLTAGTEYCFAVESLVDGEVLASDISCATTELEPTVTHPVTYLNFREGAQNRTIGLDRLQGLGSSTGRAYSGLVSPQTSAGGTVVENGEGTVLLLYSAPWGQAADSFEYFWEETASGLIGRGLVEITLTPAGAALAKFRVTCGGVGIPPADAPSISPRASSRQAYLHSCGRLASISATIAACGPTISVIVPAPVWATRVNPTSMSMPKKGSTPSR